MIKGIGITAFVFSIISLFLPFYPVLGSLMFSFFYIVWLVLVLSAVAAILGEKTFSFSAFLISIVNVLLLNTVLGLFESVGKSSDNFYLVTFILFFLVIFGFIFGKTPSLKKERLKVGEDPIFK